MATAQLLEEQEQSAEDRRVAGIEANMRAEGVSLVAQVQEDYFGFDVHHRVTFPDGITYVEHREFNEGQRKQYLNQANRDVRLQKVTGDAIIKTKPGDERAALIEIAVIGWNLIRGGKPVHFTPSNLHSWLEVANPKVVDLIHKDIYAHNPWLLAELSLEDIDKQIEELQEMRAVKVAEEEGKASSSNR
jgi:hypothetical protein